MRRRNHRRPLRSQVAKARFLIESLENRRLLTVLHGGDTFTFRAPDMNLETVHVFGGGNTTVEIIGSRINMMTAAQTITNLPGDLDGTPVNGGIVPVGGNMQGGGGMGMQPP